MPSASAVRKQIEAALADRIPSALAPVPRLLRPTASSGISGVDELLQGGLPLGAITEIVGPECSGRTSFALSFLSQMTQAGKVCAWGMSRTPGTLNQRQRPASICPGCFGFDAAPRHRRICRIRSRTALRCRRNTSSPRPSRKGCMAAAAVRIRAITSKDSRKQSAASCGRRRLHQYALCRNVERMPNKKVYVPTPPQQSVSVKKPVISGKPWSRIEQVLRVTDLLLLVGGFGAVVLDMGSVAPEFALRVPLSTWFRYRAAAEQSQTSILLLTQHACAKSSAGLVLHLQSGNPLRNEKTVFTCVEYCVEVERERFKASPANVIPLRKPPQRVMDASWHSRTAWAGPR